jgi:dienelactone hydrolase
VCRKRLRPMKKILLCLTTILIFTGIHTFASYPLGHQALTYIDASRSNRNITTDIYYPATSTGETTPIASGKFPVVVFGHGFDMGDNAYAYIKDSLVPLGYIVVFPTTESSMSPSHADFGLDLVFLINQIKTEGTSSSSFFNNHISAQSAVMGHSMGGGASFLACTNNSVPTCMVTFAAAETTPSAITAAKSVTIPALVLSGSVDCVAAPASNQVPMYDSLASACKVFISITNGSHCYFGDYNFACTFGESTCDAVPPLSRAAQHQTTLDFVKLYLDYYLKGNSTSWTVFNDSLALSSRITHLESCITTNVNENIYSGALSIWPNPSNGHITLLYNLEGKYSLTINDVFGKQVLPEMIGNNISGISKSIDISNLAKGIYFVELNINGQRLYKKILKD